MRRIALAAVLTLSFSAPAAAQDARGGPEDQDNVSPGAEFEPGVEPAPFAATAPRQPTWEASFGPGVTSPAFSPSWRVGFKPARMRKLFRDLRI
jgi:hypothetical protein